MCKAFSDKELKPNASKFDKEHLFPKDQVKQMGELGIMGIAVSSEYGGGNVSELNDGAV